MARSPLAVEITNTFLRNANADYAPKMAAYMKHKFAFHGIASPLRRELVRECLASCPLQTRGQLLDSIGDLYSGNYREQHYAALDLLWAKRKLLTAEDINLMEELITTHSWWDSVDALAKSVGGHYRIHTSHDLPHIESWMNACNLWLNRVAIIFQLGFGKATDTALLTRAIERHAASGEFFHQKAIGWALRQYSYTNPQFVLDFLDSHTLKPLSVREALKAIKRRDA
ncbi:MAG: DNA alkylation repair protein [Candidatus Kapabacteria bacterium]|nr:DNA alkylation repair protein [Candidatus Kapabacteria bacterium]